VPNSSIPAAAIPAAAAPWESDCAQGQVSEYKHFLDMNPLQFTGTEEPLDVDAWIRAIEVMFAVFTLPCSEGRKAKFVALQLCGSTLMWWEHYKSMQ
jgi:hypothetical protein